MEYQQRFAIGVDPGKLAEGHALAIVEQRRPKGSSSWRPEQAEFLVRDLQRFPPGTYYVDLEGEFSAKFSALKFRSDDILVEIALDQTAVGSSVADLILKRVKRYHPKCAVLTNDHTERETDGLYCIPKQVLIGNLEVLLETGRLKIAESLTETSTLAKELIGYRDRKTTPSLASTCWREEPADDLVFAVGLACWKLHQPPPIFGVAWLYY